MGELMYLRRIAAVGLGFAVFGTGALTLGLVIFPALMVFIRDQDRRRYAVRSLIRWTFRGFLGVLRGLGVIKLVIPEMTKLDNLKGTFIICNHPTLIDVVILMAYLKNVQCVVKKELWSNPFLGSVVRAAGYFRNDTDPEVFLDESKNQLHRGENIIIFPEGTRSVPHTPLKLVRGLGNLALASNANIQALTLLCDTVFLTKGQKWYRPPATTTTIELKIGEYFSLETYDPELPRSIRVRALMRDIQSYYNRILGYE